MSSTEVGPPEAPDPLHQSTVPPALALDPVTCAWLLSRVNGLFAPFSGPVDETLLRGMLAVSCQVAGRERGFLAVFDARGKLLRHAAEGLLPPPAARLQELRTRRAPSVEIAAGDDPVGEQLVVPIGPAAQPAQAVLLLAGARPGALVAAEALELAAALAELIGSRLQESDERRLLRDRVQELREQRRPFSSLVLASTRLVPVRRKLRRAARHRRPIFLQGEAGTEKEELARYLHAANPECAARPFAALHAGSASANHLEQQLFAAEPATTLFINHPELLAPDVQHRLADRLDSGDGELRLVAGSTQSVAGLCRGTLQPDLARQLSIRMVIPPLRSEPKEIASLAELILRDLVPGTSGDLVAISDGAIKDLISYAWPGNLRELRQVLENAAAAAQDEPIRSKHFPVEIREFALDPLQRFMTLRDVERKYIADVVAAVRNKREAAKVLGIAPSTLYEKLGRYEVDD